MRLYLSNRDSEHLYPQNTASNFRVQLPQHLLLDKDQWVCGVIRCMLPSRPNDAVYVTCNFVESAILGGKHQPVLCLLTSKTNDFPHIPYTKVKDNQLSQIQVKLVNRQGTQIDLKRGETVIVLEFRKNHDFCESFDRPF